MTPEERKSLAEQLQANPLFGDIMNRLERDALEALVTADTEQGRIEAQWRVQAARTFRRDLDNSLSTPKRRGAPA